MLADAIKRSLKTANEQIGSAAIIVDPIDADAERFYLKYGFTKIPDSGKMFVTVRKIEEAFRKEE